MRREPTSREIRQALRKLDGSSGTVKAVDWPGDLNSLNQRGLYSWWVDASGAKDLSAGLGQTVEPGLIYAGQAGATKWPSGTQGTATLGSRIRRQHIAGRIRSSTFRFTLAASLRTSLGLKAGGKGMSPESEAQLSDWIREHLSVAVHAFPDRDALSSLEDEVLDELDPPLNLQGRGQTELRLRLRGLRSELGRGCRSTRARKTTARSSSKPRPGVGRRGSRAAITLHEEIAEILRGHGWMSTKEIAAAVNQRGRYAKRDGSAVTPFQIHGRTRNYGQLFERDGSNVRLK